MVRECQTDTLKLKVSTRTILSGLSALKWANNMTNKIFNLSASHHVHRKTFKQMSNDHQ